MRCRLTVLAAMLLIAGFTQQAESQSIRFVNGDAPSNGNGLSWSTAYDDLFEALDEAAKEPAIAEIWVAEGVYTPDRGAHNRNDAFVLVPGVSVYGGFAGNETSLGQRDPVANATTLSGDFNGNDGPNFSGFSENAFHVVTASNFTASAAIDGFKIRGGNANFNPNLLLGGGGMYLLNAAVDVRNCTLMANSAGVNQPNIGGFGGAIFIRSGAVNVADCLFTANRGDNGGAIGVRDLDNVVQSVTFTDCQFINNAAIHQTGGAVWTGNGPLDGTPNDIAFIRCLFEDNTAQYGGAILEQNSNQLHVIDCTFTGNEAFVLAGALWHTQTVGPDVNPAVIRGCSFINNIGNDSGGAIQLSAVDAVVSHCRFLNNQANGTGGAIISTTFFTAFGSQDLFVDHCDFAGNSALTGGAIAAIRNPIFRLSNSTLTNNTAGSLGGGIFSETFFTDIDNSILWNNSAGGSMDENDQVFHNPQFGPMQVNHCIVMGLTGQLGGVGNLDDDPAFIDAEGPDSLPGTVDDNFNLAQGSAAIDVGSLAALAPDLSDIDDDGDAAEPTPLDLDGNPSVSGRNIDIGAHELPIDAAPGDVTGDGIVNIDDVFAVIAAWGECPQAGSCLADLDGDGTVDIDDLFIVLTNWSL